MRMAHPTYQVVRLDWLAAVAFALLLAACASPTVTLRLSYPIGKIRTYKVTAVIGQKIDVATLHDDETIQLEATSRLEIIDVGTTGATLKLTITPTRFERNGRRSEPPAPQEVMVQVGEDGAIAKVEAPGGQQVRPDDILGVAPLIGAVLPTGRVHLGSRWRRTLPAPAPGAARGVQTGRLAAYRVVNDRSCAILALDSRRSIRLTRQAAGQQLNLTGTEITASEVALDFSEGFPVRIRSEAEGRFAVQGAPSREGDVIIKTETTLVLV